MSIRETSRARRDRWPLEFDLEGVPRDNAERERLVQQKKILETENEMNKVTPVRNEFAVDYQQGQTIDLSKPLKVPYNPHDPKNEFPKLIYHHENGHVLQVADAKQEKAALRKGYQLQPSPHHDYSKARVGIAAPKKAAALPTAEELLSEEDEAALEAENEKE